MWFGVNNRSKSIFAVGVQISINVVCEDIRYSTIIKLPVLIKTINMNIKTMFWPF